MLSSASRASINLQFALRNNLADIQGKSVSQYTASTLFGTGIGMALTGVIDVTKMEQILPCFLGLTVIQGTTTHMSTRIVNEQYLNNQRANLVFENYFKEGKFPLLRDVNLAEKYWYPNFMNPQRCLFIRYGKNSIGTVLTS